MLQDVSESYSVEEVRVGVGICAHPPVRIVILRLAIRRSKHVQKKKMRLALIGFTAPGRPVLVICGRVLRGQARKIMATVATSAMMRKNATRKTLLTVTMSMMTTMTTVPHRDLENDW